MHGVSQVPLQSFMTPEFTGLSGEGPLAVHLTADDFPFNATALLSEAHFA